MSFHLKRLRAITVGFQWKSLKVLRTGASGAALSNEANYIKGREPHSSRGIIKGLYMDLYGFTKDYIWI